MSQKVKIGDVVIFDFDNLEGVAVIFKTPETSGRPYYAGMVLTCNDNHRPWPLSNEDAALIASTPGLPQVMQGKEVIGGWKIALTGIKSIEGNLFGTQGTHTPKPVKFDLKLDALIMSEDKKRAIINLIMSADSEASEKLWKEWGFEETIEKGKGTAMLFYGPPGTGKTKCAELIAKEIGFKFELVDTATLWSSEPGATERKLKEIFKKASDTKTLLCFDECDSLIYDRNRVGMIIAAEINCLLSELERYAGITVFTTNRTPKLDKAFQRRLQLKLEFDPPTPAERQQIWRTLIPMKAPLNDDVCFKTLSMSDLSGGNIKNCVVNAARFAIQEKAEKIDMKHLNEAVRLELNGIAAFAEEDADRPWAPPKSRREE